MKSKILRKPILKLIFLIVFVALAINSFCQNYSSSISIPCNYSLLFDGAGDPNWKIGMDYSAANDYNITIQGASTSSNPKRRFRIMNYNGSELLNVNFNSGNIGIGTLTPLQKFVVSNSGAEGFEVYLGQPTGTVGLQSYNRTTSAYSNMEFDASQFAFNHGAVSIGTTAAPASLNLYGVFSGQLGTNSDLTISNWALLGNPTVTLNAHNDANSAAVPMAFSASQYYFHYGPVGINTSTTFVGGTTYQLAVGGSIVATEVDVLTVPASDYVFEPGYKLKSLSETESYVKENKHLPDVPSASEFKEKGCHVGQMQDILLRKVEELTLLMIEQNKSIETLKQENSALKAKVEEISNK